MSTALRRNRAFLALLTSEAVVRLATGLRRVAVPWLVLELTGSPLQLGLALALGAAPDVVVAPVVGHLVDSLPGRSTAGAAVLAEAALLAVVPLVAAGWTLRAWHLFVVLALVSVTRSVFHNTRETLLPAVVADERLDEANSLFYVAGGGLSLAFVLLGGVLTGLLGAVETLGYAAGATAVAALPLAALPAGAGRSAGEAAEGALSVAELRDSLAGAFAVVRGSVVWDLLLFGMAINVAVVPFSLVVAAMGESLFGLAVAYGVLLAAYRGGTLLGNLAVGRLAWNRRRSYTVGVLGVGAAALTTGLVGPLLVPLSELARLAGLSALLALVGGCIPLFNVPSDSMVQIASEEHRGTVVTLTNAALQAPFPLAFLAGGYLVERLSPFAVFVLSGLLLLATGTVAVARFEVTPGAAASEAR